MTSSYSLWTTLVKYRYVIATVLVLPLYIAISQQSAEAACAAQPTTYGSASTTINVPTTGTYRVWSRIMAPDANSNSYTLEIDDTTCGIVVGDSAITANTWTWVDYKTGTSTSKISLSLTAGAHTVKMIGREADVKLDRVILTADTTCVPTGTGDNCASPPDTTPPVVSVTTPTAGATVTGPTTINATATDDVAISKVEFYIDNVLRNTDTTASYSYSFDMSTLSPGAHTIYAKAYDTANNATSSTTVGVTVPTPADTTPPSVSISSPTAGTTISGTSSVSANAADAVGVTKVEFYVDAALVATDTTSPYTASVNTTTLTNAAHNLTAKAFDTANNTTTSSPVSVTVSNVVTPPADTTAPSVSITNPTAGQTISGTAAVSATATDNVGVTKVEFYVDGVLKNSDTSAPFDYAIDTATLTNAAHSFTAKAFDAANNTKTSAAVSATVSNIVFIAEDINQDGKINVQDFSLLAAKFGQTGAGLGRADINGDAKVNIQDFSLLAAKFGQ